MNAKILKTRITPYIPRLALFLFAIAPLTESNDWIFYINSVLIIGLFVLAIVGAVQVYRKDKENFIGYMAGSLQDNLYDLIIGIIGLIISYSMNLPRLAYFWWFVIAGSVISIIDRFHPFKCNSKDKNKKTKA